MANARKQPPAPPPSHAPEVVDPIWLLKAGAISAAVALLFAYVAICILFSHGQWQLVLHPSRTTATAPAWMDLHPQAVEFGPGVKGWWIAGDATNDPTALMLISGDGSAADWWSRAKTLHDARMNVLLFDYRGYGASSGQHPDEASMEADSESALSWLTGTRNIPANSIVLYGTAAGASLAVRLSAEHPEIPALILEQPKGDFRELVSKDARATLAPFGMLFTQDFPLADPLHTLKTPKLLISFTSGPPPEVAKRAADPKTMLELPNPGDEKDLQDALRRFLDTYITRPPGTLTPQR
jgi:pimeloyl-ACP methyl ester carboxylesterase